MGGSGSKKPSSASGGGAAQSVVRFGVGTAGAAEAAYPLIIDPNALLYTKHSKPYGKQVRWTPLILWKKMITSLLPITGE